MMLVIKEGVGVLTVLSHTEDAEWDFSIGPIGTSRCFLIAVPMMSILSPL